MGEEGGEGGVESIGGGGRGCVGKEGRKEERKEGGEGGVESIGGGG